VFEFPQWTERCANMAQKTKKARSLPDVVDSFCPITVLCMKDMYGSLLACEFRCINAN
jgi:hypothetical protein